MSEIIMSEQYKLATELNQKIIVTATLAQQNLYDMCVMLKQMRDDKLYKELGYQNFEEYCENEVGFSRRNARNYISVVEKINMDGKLISRIGMTKLSLLASLSESQQEEIQQTVNLENTTVKELKAEIEKLKAEKAKAENRFDTELQQAREDKTFAEQSLLSIKSEKRQLQRQLNAANERITELESRPVEVAVQEEDKEAKALVKTLSRQLSESDLEHANELERQRKQYQQKINSLEEQLEQQKTAPAKMITVSNEKEIFNAYYATAINAFHLMLDFISLCENDKVFCIEKAKQLLSEFENELGGIS